MIGEGLIETVLRRFLKEFGVTPLLLLVEVEGERFQFLVIFQQGNESYGVVKCKGRVELFFNFQLLQKFKEELRRQVEKREAVAIAVFESTEPIYA